MRKLLFAHDDRVSIDSAGQPMSYNYTRHLIDRYRYLADRVSFAVRCDAMAPIAWFDDARIHCIPEMKHGRSLLRYRQAKRSVASLVAEHDLVVARLPSLIGSWALRAAWRLEKPVLVEFVGCPWDALWNHSVKGKLVAPFFRLKNRWLMQRASHSIYVTEAFLQSRYPTAGASIPCSDVEVDLAPEAAIASRGERLRRLARQRPIVLGTIANLDVPYKGHDLVLRALAALGESRQTLLYRMIGPGDPGRLQQLAEKLGVSEQVSFVGGVERDAIPAQLDRIDLYLQPSRQEGLPRAMLEAMARGCVIIGARTGGIPELLPSAWVVPRGDWKAIARLLGRLEQQDLVAASRQNWETASRFRLDILTEQRQRFYDRFLTDYHLERGFQAHAAAHG